MNAYYLLFRTSRFNLSEVKSHFINPCCFGEDVAAWLQAELAKRGTASQGPSQEDWGWYLRVRHENRPYYLNVSGNRDEANAEPNVGEWRIIVERRRSLLDKITARNLMQEDDPLFRSVEVILQQQADFLDIRRETDEQASGRTLT
jgi:hypothetical protein